MPEEPPVMMAVLDLGVVSWERVIVKAVLLNAMVLVVEILRNLVCWLDRLGVLLKGSEPEPEQLRTRLIK